MCELLGMSANVPTDICFSFQGLMQRGGKTGIHRDGWGIAFYEGKGCRTFHDPNPSFDSPVAHLIRDYPIKSRTVISHIRQATHGKICLENTHPFRRELWGRDWIFAHNGKLKGVKQRALNFFRPIGGTDSEHAFCWMLEELRQRYPDAPPPAKKLYRLIKDLAGEIAGHGVCNFLLSDSRALYAHCSTHLAWITRRAPFGDASLIDDDLTVDFSQETGRQDVVTVFATRPLTENEDWSLMAKGEYVVFRNGEAAFR